MNPADYLDDELVELLEHDPADDEVAPSLFVQMMSEVLGPLDLELDLGRDGIAEVEVDVPPADAVAGLDDLGGPTTIHDWLELVCPSALSPLEDRPWAATLRAVRDVREHFGLVALPRGTWTYVVEQVDLYGEAIDRDLADRGHDLLDWFRGRRPWPQLLRLLPGLPAGSHYWAALLDDEDLARERIESEGDTPRKGSTRPPLVGESQERTLLRAIASALPRIEHAVFAVNAPKGKAGSPPSPMKGPQTAEDRLRDQMGDQDVEDVIAAVAPAYAAERAPGFRTSSSGLYVPDR